MNSRILCLAVLLGLTACGGSKSDEPKAKQAKQEDKSADEAASVETAFAKGAPALPAELAKAAFGADEATVLASLGADSVFMDSKQYKDVSYRLDITDDNGLESIEMSAPESLEDTLTKLWGAPVKNADGEAFWFAPEQSLRASLTKRGEGKTVKFETYVPLAKFLGPSGFELAFVGDKALFGATLDELQAAWGEVLCEFDEEAPKIREGIEKNAADSMYRLQDVKRNVSMCFPGLRGMAKYATRKDSVLIGLDGKVASLSLASIDTGGSAEFQDQMAAVLEAKFGKPVEVESSRGTERFYFDPESKMRARASFADGHEWVSLSTEPYMPAADLFAGDQPGLSIENDKIIGGTFEEIKAADPDHFRQSGVLASLIYPPTEEAQGHTVVKLDRWDKKDQTHGYSVVLHYKQESTGDAIFDMLKQKFGEPKKDDARSKDDDIYYLFEANGRKVSARRVSSQWQISVTQ